MAPVATAADLQGFPAHSLPHSTAFGFPFGWLLRPCRAIRKLFLTLRKLGVSGDGLRSGLNILFPFHSRPSALGQPNAGEDGVLPLTLAWKLLLL